MISHSLREAPSKVWIVPTVYPRATCRSYDGSEKSAWRSAKRNALSGRPNVSPPRRLGNSFGLVATGEKGVPGSCWVFLSPMVIFLKFKHRYPQKYFWCLHLERFHFSQVVYINCGISECCSVWSTWRSSPKLYLMFSGSKLVDAGVICVCVCLLCLCSTSNFTCFQ